MEIKEACLPRVGTQQSIIWDLSSKKVVPLTHTIQNASTEPEKVLQKSFYSKEIHHKFSFKKVVYFKPPKDLHSLVTNISV